MFDQKRIISPTPSSTPTQSSGQTPHTEPHKLMKCEKGTWLLHVPFSHFGGGGGLVPPQTTGLVPPQKTWSPHKKIRSQICVLGIIVWEVMRCFE